eukprot:335251_1
MLFCLLCVVLFHFMNVMSSFILGADMSYLDDEDCNGACSPFKLQSNGATDDALKMLKSNGFTAIRMRIWNDPSPSDSYCNLTGVLFMAKRIYNNGLQLQLSIDYSDEWANPGQQTKPSLWSNLHGKELISAVYNYTFMVITALKQQNTLPFCVQIGNEIGNGMLWASQGEPCEYGGCLYCDGCTDNWSMFAQLISAGINAVRAVDSNIIIEIHTELGNSLKYGINGVEWIADWYTKLHNVYNAKFDQIGLSFYPGWCMCPLSSWNYMSQFIEQYFKGQNITLSISETSYPWNPNGTYNWSSTYPFTAQGQLEYVQSMMDMLQSGNISGWNGFYWWGTEYYQRAAPQYGALWDTNAVALPSLLKGWT